MLCENLYKSLVYRRPKVLLEKMLKPFVKKANDVLALFVVFSVVLWIAVVNGCDSKCQQKGHSHSEGTNSGNGRSINRAKVASNAFNVTLGPSLDETEARRIAIALEPWITEMCYVKTKAEWDFVTDLTPENEAASLQATLDYTAFHRTKYWPMLTKFDWRNFKDPTLKRQFRSESLLGTSALSDEKFKRITELKSDMVKIYSTAKVCDFQDRQKCEMTLDPDITSVLAQCRDPEELKHYWIAWRDATGRKMKEMYSEFVDISNEAARLNGYHDQGEYWRRPYEDPNLPLELWTIWGQISPFYKQLHAYVRRRLHNKFGNKWVTLRGTIPAHLLGNMWGQNWFNMWDILVPYEGSSEMDITDAMRAANYTVLSMFQKADEFFQSLGLLPMTPGFWKGSIFERPPAPKQIVCHPEAWEWCTGKDFYIKMCTSVTGRDFITVHHEMGHIQYYMQYKDQLNTFREGANPGFHEAIGDTIAMSVGSPGHLQSIGLLKNYEDTHKNKINFLMSQALKLLVDLPWDLVLEQWRWDVFCGKVNITQYNCHWWNLRSHVQGLRPPVTRSWEDFDPGAKYHIPNGTPYERYFVARLLMYQLHEALCKEAGQYKEDGSLKPLHMCSIHGSKEAGKKLADMLKLGSSVPWPVALEKVTGKRTLDAASVLNYYAPLAKWLEEENKRNGDEPGWENDEQEDLCTPKYPIP